jgi:O-antigen ligase
MFVPLSAVGMSLSRYTAILYFLTIIPEIKLFVRTDRIGNILLLAWAFFGLLTMMSVLNINEVSKEFFNLPMFQNILLFWILINHARKDYLILEKGMLFFAFGCIGMAILYIMGIGVEFSEGRLSMFKENENALGLSMILGILILLLSVIQDKLQIGKIRYLFLVPIPLMLNFVFATGSRLAFISFVLCVVAGIVLFKTPKKSGKLIAISIGIAGLVILGILLMQQEVMRDRLLKSAQEGDLAKRDDIWRSLLPLIKENPVFGVGDTGYSLFSAITFGGEKSPHNVLIEVICITGFAGLLIYFSFLYTICMRGYEIYRKNGLLLPVLLSIPLLGAIFSGQILTRKIGWVILAYIVGSAAIKTKSMKITRNKQLVENENIMCD